MSKPQLAATTLKWHQITKSVWRASSIGNPMKTEGHYNGMKLDLRVSPGQLQVTIAQSDHGDVALLGSVLRTQAEDDDAMLACEALAVECAAASNVHPRLLGKLAGGELS